MTRSILVSLTDRKGRVVRRTRIPEGTTFLLNIKDGHYYDRQPCCGRFMRRASPCASANPGDSK